MKTEKCPFCVAESQMEKYCPNNKCPGCGGEMVKREIKETPGYYGYFCEESLKVTTTKRTI